MHTFCILAPYIKCAIVYAGSVVRSVIVLRTRSRYDVVNVHVVRTWSV